MEVWNSLQHIQEPKTADDIFFGNDYVDDLLNSYNTIEMFC